MNRDWVMIEGHRDLTGGGGSGGIKPERGGGDDGWIGGSDE